MPRVVIEAGNAEGRYWRDLWRFRELFYFLAWRDILVRYKQTTIGIAWSVIRPLLTMIVMVLIFSRVAGLSSDGVPYPILVFTALLPWQFFANALSECSGSLIANSNVISKVYFPRLIVPVSSLIVCFIDFLISAGILILLMFWYRFVPDWRIFTLPLFTWMAFAAALGPGIFLAALNVKYRDFRYIVPFIAQFGLYISPVGFSSARVYQSVSLPEWLKFLYALNPMVGVIDGFRWAILGRESVLNPIACGISFGVVFLMLIIGIVYFRKTERTFADVM